MKVTKNNSLVCKGADGERAGRKEATGREPKVKRGGWEEGH